MGRGGEGRSRSMPRCGCLFSCQFLLETFPVRRKLEEEAKEHTRAEIWSSSLTLILTPGGCRSSAKPSGCHSLDGSTSSHLGCQITLWGQRALSSLSRSLQLRPSSPGLPEPPNIRHKQQNSFRSRITDSGWIVEMVPEASQLRGDASQSILPVVTNTCTTQELPHFLQEL